jgi:glycosyltransferase involved in cell wall biosynthesis
MRVIMHTRADWRELAGGDFVQLQRWAVWLRALGVDVRVSASDRPDLRGVDLVHFNNLSRAYSHWPAVRHCRAAGVPIVLTPLYWPVAEYDRKGRPGWLGLLSGLLPRDVRERLKAAARLVRQPAQRAMLLEEIWHGARRCAQRFLAAFDALVANSKPEAAQLQRLQPAHPPIHVVHSGVDASYWADDAGLIEREAVTLIPDTGEERRGQPRAPAPQPGADAERRGVLCVARFDPQKGQHRLLQALQGLAVPVTLAGPDNPNFPRYRRLCARLAGPETTILPRQTSEELHRLYQRCRVHALVSWYETTGLTGLEAGCSGARVVMTARGGTKDYGGELAWYADPADLGSIRRAVEAALAAPTTPDLRARVRERFTWEASARALLRVYGEVLAGAAGRRAA